MRDVDVCIIGAGPAGMSAAIECAKAGCKVTLLDEQPFPGGQIYRNVGNGRQPQGALLGPDYTCGAELVKTLSSLTAIEYIPRATLWRVDRDRTVFWSRDGKAEQLRARRIILATGALERPFPFPGWTLPGVMTAGAAQIALKTSGIVPVNSVMVGTGPLLYLLAVQLIKAGSPPKAIVDTQTPERYLKAARHVYQGLAGYPYLIKGLKLLAQIRQAGIPHYRGVKDIAAQGTDQIEALTFTRRGKSIRLETGVVLSHIGVIPNCQLTRAMEIEHHWDSIQQCWRPELDSRNNTSVPGVAVAGDGAGIGGAIVAGYQGKLTACETLFAIGRIPETQWQEEIRALQGLIKKELTVRPLLDTLYAPPQQALEPEDNTIVCRCEEVTAGEIREFARKGCRGINQMKAFTRCGMGPCQGRYCGTTVASVIAGAGGISPNEAGYYRIRYPVKPLTLGELASLTSEKHSFITPYRKKETVREQH